MTQNPEQPCTECNKPTRLLWSADIDLPRLPFCCRTCAAIWELESRMKIGEEERAAMEAEDEQDTDE